MSTYHNNINQIHYNRNTTLPKKIHSKHKYQLISPVIGNNLYIASSLKSGAAKCFNDLKQLDVINANYFTIIDIDTFETFKFQIDKNLINHNMKTKINNDLDSHRIRVT